MPADGSRRIGFELEVGGRVVVDRDFWTTGITAIISKHR